MSVIHKVEQGEFLAKIAQKYGFTDYKAIWNHPKNAQLKKKRVSPNVLNPGDMLFIPDKTERQESRGTTKVHNFVASARKVELQIVLTDVSKNPVDGATGTLKVEKSILTANSGGDGLIKYEIPISSEKGDLTVESEKLIAGGRRIPLVIGHLNDLETEPFDSAPEKASEQRAAWRDRLNNMGFFAGYEDTDEEQFRWALEEFQCEHMKKDNSSPKAKPSGVCDAETRDAMRAAYGC
jgi:hypothetical protein